MNKRLRVTLLVTILIFGAATTALAYTGVLGSVVDANGDPWTYGGEVVCVQSATNVELGRADIQPDGSWYVFIGSPSAATCTIDPAAGPSGDPAPYTCDVPSGGGGGVLDYDCGEGSTGTGPNAVVLSGLGAAAGMPAGALVLALSAVLGGAAVWLRRR